MTPALLELDVTYIIPIILFQKDRNGVVKYTLEGGQNG